MITIKSGNYSIYFGNKSYQKLNLLIEKNQYSNIFLITDTLSNEFCVPRFMSFLETNLAIEIIEFDNGEENKKLDTCISIWNVLTELGADRKSLVINLGGGVVTDLGGFVASTFKRGIDFINVPTTLLSMVDASIGGKTGVDLGSLKNQIGVINFPEMILIDHKYLDTLPKNEMLSGLAEMLKHGLIYDKNYWESFLDLKLESNLPEKIHRSVFIKNEIVSQDPTEKGIRKSLNFGHTLGHAIESYFLENKDKKTLLHGEAIAIGMILESYISMDKKMISGEEFLEIKTLIDSLYKKVEFTEKDIENILKNLIHDKKNEYGEVKFSLIEGIGKNKINQLVDIQSIVRSFEVYKK